MGCRVYLLCLRELENKGKQNRTKRERKKISHYIRIGDSTVKLHFVSTGKEQNQNGERKDRIKLQPSSCDCFKAKLHC